MSLPAVVPAPAVLVAHGSDPFRLGERTPLTGDAAATALLTALVAARTGAALGDAGAVDSPPNRARAAIVHVDGEGPAESYRIAVTAAGIEVAGSDAAGLFYGVHTLVQLVDRDDEGWFVPAVEIADAPRFGYRGVMLDVARHFHPVDTVTAYIDRAASLKFNHLHLHLSDDQGWRLQLRSRPLLTERGADSSVGGDPGGHYTQDDYRAIVAHAADRHMTVVPEFDVPGHTHAVSLAYPELCEEPVLSDHIRDTVRDHGGGLPVNGVAYDGLAVGFSSLRIHDEATYAFLADVFGELAELTPGPYLHLGGDEALGTGAEDFATFVSRASAIVAATGKTPIAWHEAGAVSGIAPDTVGQYWGYVQPIDGMDEKTRAFARRGARVILSPADAIYLDMKFDADSPLGLTWARGVTSVERSYAWEPAAVIDGVGEDDILGVEAPLWTETARTLDDIDALAFPRIAAAAEAAWSPAVGASDLRTWESFRERVARLGPLWHALGIRFTRSPEIPWAP